MKLVSWRKGGESFELLPSRNKCYITYLSQMLSCKFMSERLSSEESPAEGGYHRAVINQRSMLICSWRLSLITLFPRLTCSPGERVHCGDSCRLIKSESAVEEMDQLIAVIRQVWELLTSSNEVRHFKRGRFCDWVCVGGRGWAW